jgi:hypothetical protein
MYIFTGEPAWNPVPLDTASGSRSTHLAIAADLTPADADRTAPDRRVGATGDCRINWLFSPRPSGSASSPRPDSFIVKSAPDTSRPVAARCAFGATDTAAGAPLTRNTDPPCGTPAAGIFGFT